MCVSPSERIACIGMPEREGESKSKVNQALLLGIGKKESLPPFIPTKRKLGGCVIRRSLSFKQLSVMKYLDIRMRVEEKKPNLGDLSFFQCCSTIPQSKRTTTSDKRSRPKTACGMTKPEWKPPSINESAPIKLIGDNNTDSKIPITTTLIMGRSRSSSTGEAVIMRKADIKRSTSAPPRRAILKNPRDDDHVVTHEVEGRGDNDKRNLPSLAIAKKQIKVDMRNLSNTRAVSGSLRSSSTSDGVIGIASNWNDDDVNLSPWGHS
jgi:hypothetical protein